MGQRKVHIDRIHTSDLTQSAFNFSNTRIATHADNLNLVILINRDLGGIISEVFALLDAVGDDDFRLLWAALVDNFSLLEHQINRHFGHPKDLD